MMGIKALEVMQSAPIEQQEAFATIIHTLLPPEPVPSQSNPPPAKKKKVVAYLLITGQTFQAHQQILDHLNKGPLSISVTEDVQQCDVILLFCPILSRVRSDVESAFRKIPDGAQDKPVVLVLLHHTRKPDQVLKQTQWMDEFPMVIQEVNVLYHESQNGLLYCPRNQEALQNLQSIESRFPKNLLQDSKYKNIESFHM
uniref:Uncharacterized protein n=1 Tax=Knipowitschia caucasica TaxID=637954 RepID=A0AAV2J7K6_KNICA